MANKKRSIKNTIDNNSKTDDPRLPKKSLFRVDEVADYFNVSRATIYLWIDHGILKAEKYNHPHGIIRIPRESILSCRINNQLNPME